MYEFVGADDWKDVALYEAANWKNGLAFKNIDFSNVGLPVIKIAELKNGISGQTKFTEATYPPEVFIQSGDMLFAWSGSPQTSIDTFIWDGDDGWLNQHIFKVTPSEIVGAEYLFFLLKSLRPRFVRIALNKQTTGLGHVTVADLKEMRVGIPSPAEQKDIVSIVGPIQQKIETNRRMNETLEEMARAIFKIWFVDFDPVHANVVGNRPAYMDAETAALFPSRLGDDGLPEGWTCGTYDDAMSIYDAKRVPLSKLQREKRQGEFPYYGAAALMDHVDAYLFDGIYLLMGEDGSVTHDDGTPFLQYVWGKFWVNNHAHVLQGANGFSTEFLFCGLSSINISPYVTGAVQAKLNQANMKRMPLVTPTKEVLNAFDFSVLPLFEKRRLNIEESKTLAQLRDALLPKLMSGEIRVMDAEKEIEAVA
ncbi:MAG: restriction endonuclease subunit S [Bacteroidetes Order II. Incertae sedis bacterium]|nr:restriction endonuclease subunit S [Bacteroidetes Order II. bacterium]